MFFLFFLDAHTVGEGWLADDEVVLVARVVEVLGAADEVVEVLDTIEEVEVLEVLGAGAADDELELVEVVLNDLDEVLVSLVEVLVDLVVVIYTVCVREGVDSLHRRTYRNTGWSFYARACRAHKVLCEEFELPEKIRDCIFGQDPGQRLCCSCSGGMHRSRCCGWLPIDCDNASLGIGCRQPLMKCLSRSGSDGTFRFGEVRRAKSCSWRVSRQRKKVGVDATRAHRVCNHNERD